MGRNSRQNNTKTKNTQNGKRNTKYKAQMHCKQNYTFAVSICVKMAAQNDVFELIINGSQYNS